MHLHIQQPADAIAALAGCCFFVAAVALRLRRFEGRVFLFVLGLVCLGLSAFVL